MTDEYFAGLIDGEGYVGLVSAGLGRLPVRVVEVNMTCRKTIEALHAHYGGQINRRKVPDDNQPQWRWRCQGEAAVAVMLAVFPYSITKAETIRSVLAAPRTRDPRVRRKDRPRPTSNAF